MDLDANEKIKNIINIKEWLWKCEWKWDNKEKNFQPFLILAPSLGTNTGEPLTSLRVYACGGRLYDIRTIETDLNDEKVTKFDKKYLNYTIPNHPYGHSQKVSVPELFLQEYKSTYDSHKDITTLLFNINSFEDIKSSNKKKALLDFIILGARNRNTKKNGTKHERWIQTEIVKDNILNKFEVNSEDNQYLIFDMEYEIKFNPPRPKTKRNVKGKIIELEKVSKSTEIDLILFDGKKFGFIELKYNGESMEKGNSNNLREHYLDFYEAKKQMGNIQNELIRRLWFLFKYRIIDESWKEPLNTIGICKDIWNKKYVELLEVIENNSVIFDYWYGFLFYNDEHSTKNQKIIESKMEEQVKLEYKDFNMPLKYCYYEKGTDKKIAFSDIEWK